MDINEVKLSVFSCYSFVLATVVKKESLCVRWTIGRAYALCYKCTKLRIEINPKMLLLHG